jgi:diaminopimelate epimerase
MTEPSETPMVLQFTKMQGLGNDFVIIDERDQVIPILTPHLIQALADRRKGVGCDQVIMLSPSSNADVYMTIYNADGGQSQACGNGTRCVAAYLNQTDCLIETQAGTLQAWLRPDNKIVVNMGVPRVNPEAVELHLDPLPPIIEVNIGNSHAVAFVDDAEKIDLETFGPQVENHSHFTEAPNVEFASPMKNRKIRMRVWERGVGITPACGTGACAVAVAAMAHGFTPKGSPIEVVLDGGSLLVSWDSDGSVIQTGPAMKSFRGEFPLEL